MNRALGGRKGRKVETLTQISFQGLIMRRGKRGGYVSRTSPYVKPPKEKVFI